MRLSTRSGSPRRLRMPALLATGLATGLVLATTAATGALSTSADAASRTLSRAATGTVSRVGASTAHRSHATSMGLTRPSTAAAASPSTRHGVHRSLEPERPLTQAGPQARRTPPSTTGHALVGAARASSRVGTFPKVLASFDGVDAVQNQAASGFNSEPPDEGLAAGQGKVVNFVNVTGRIYRQDGTPLTQPFYLNPFFHETADAQTSDPRVYYDADTGRWIASLLGYTLNSDGSAVTESHVDLAFSDSSDPTGAWHVYRIPASDPGHAGCPCLADYPILGVSKANVYLSTNEFTGDLNDFNGAQLYAISKSQLASGAASPNVVQFENLAAGGSLGYHVQPANTPGNSPAEYLMSSLDPNGTFDNRLAVWAVTNENAVTTGAGLPALSVRVIQSQGYSPPPAAQTPPGRCTGTACGSGGSPTTGIVEANDDAMQEVQNHAGLLVGALGTGVTIAGDSGPRSGAAWFVVRPALSGAQVASSTKVVRQGYVSHQGEYLLFPHVNMTANGSMAMVAGLGSPSTYLSSAYSVAKPGQGFGAVHVLAAGTGPDNGFTGTKAFGGQGRWGDYSNGEWIPGTNQVWLATQYIPNTGTGYANWGQSIFGLKLIP